MPPSQTSVLAASDTAAEPAAAEAAASAEARATDAAAAAPARGPKPLVAEKKAAWEQIALYVFVIVPFLALAVAVPVAWGWGIGWHDVVLSVLFYAVTGLGVTVGFHRYLT